MQLAQAISIFAGDQSWYGVDFDGTLAKQTKYSPTELGKPNPEVVAKVRQHLDRGDTVKLYTARAENNDPKEIAALQKWMKLHVGTVLPITNQKDEFCLKIYDNIARQVKNGHIVEAGGPGSGCNGPNCGRPLGSGNRESEKDTVTRLIKDRTRRDLPPGPGQRHYADEFKKATKEYKKQTLKPSLKKMAEWHSKIGEWKGLSPDELHKLRTTEEGDRGATLEKVKAWDERVGAVKTYPMGTKVGIEAVVPPTGNTPPYFTVRFPGGGSAHVPLDSVYIEKRIEAPKVDVQPVRKSDVVQTSRTQDGAQYTVVRPSSTRAEETSPRTREHGLKGSFEDVTGTVKGLDDPDRRSVVYFAKYKGAGADPAGSEWVSNPDTPGTFKQVGTQGSTVFIHRYLGDKSATIQEVNTGQYGHRFGTAKEWKYKNLGSAAGFLNKRYGIRLSVKGLK